MADSLKGQILVMGKDAVTHAAVLTQAICDRLRSRLLIHTETIGGVSESEIKGSDAVVIAHDRKDGVDGEERLLSTVSILQTLGVGAIIVLGVSNLKLRKELQKRTVHTSRNGLGRTNEDELVRGIQDALPAEGLTGDKTSQPS